MTDRIQQYGTSVSRLGTAGMSGLTLFADDEGYHVPPAEEAAEAAGEDVGGNPALALAGAVALLGIIWIVQYRLPEGVNAIKLNLLNVLVIGTLSTVFILAGKVLFARYPLPGVSQFFGAL